MLAVTWAIGIFVVSPVLVEFIRTGDLYYRTVQPFPLSGYIQCFFHSLSLSTTYIFGSFISVIYFEPYLHLAQSYKIIAIDIRSLRREETAFTEVGVYLKLCRLLRKVEENFKLSIY